MSDFPQKPARTQYAMTVALLIGAFIFSPAVLIVSRPYGYVALWLTLACSALCVAMAWINWKSHSELAVPSISPRYLRAG